jgi:DNA helicase HerA-like ATPase
MLRNYAMERLKLPETSMMFSTRGFTIPAVMQGKVPVGLISLWRKHWNGRKLPQVNINDFLQHHSCSFGITRSGKSNGCGRLCEELLLKGMRIIVVDYKGEFITLSELQGVRVLVLPIAGRNGKEDARAFSEGTQSYILNLETITDEIYVPYLLDFFTELWELQRQLKMDANNEGHMIVPVKIFVDEAQHFVGRISAKAMPKDLGIATRNLKGIFKNIAQQGVGLGLPMHFSTQRPTYLEPWIRNQVEVLLLYRQKWENDIEVYLDVIPANGGGFKVRDMRKHSIEMMATGVAIYVGTDGQTLEMQMLKKRTRDLSKTPGWAQQVEAMEAIRHGWQKDNPTDMQGTGEET